MDRGAEHDAGASPHCTGSSGDVPSVTDRTVVSFFCSPFFRGVSKFAPHRWLLFLGSVNLSLEPTLDLIPLCFSQFLVAWHIEGSIQTAVNRCGMASCCFTELRHIIFHAVLMLGSESI